jgi:methyl-accepting chemotaxis protein
MKEKKFLIEVFPWIIIFLSLILIYYLFKYIYFNPILFLIFSIVFFLARFIRISLKRFSILTLTPIFAFLFPLYSGGFTSGISNLLGVFLGERIWRKTPLFDTIRSSFTYASAILILSLILPPKGNPSFYKILIFYLLFSLIFPYLFYLPKFFELKFKELFYISIWEHIFALTMNGLAYAFYKISTSKINLENILYLIFIILLGLIIFNLIKIAIYSDKLNFERKILKILKEKLSFESGLKEVEKLLKEEFKIKELKIAICENKDEVKIIYSTNIPSLLKNPIKVKKSDGNFWEVIENKKYKYLPHSKENGSEIAFPLIYNEKLVGILICKSEKKEGFYEDDIRRLERILEPISSSLELLINISNLKEISCTLDKDAEHLAGITEEFSGSVGEISEKILKANKNLENARDLLQKNFEILENIGKTMEDVGSESEEILITSNDFFKKIQEGYESYLNLKKFQENFSKEYAGIKEEFEKFLSFYRRIQELIEFMVDYTTKTRLLSLNAAIEAARFEEKKSGFGIIAEEIGKLAEVGEDLTKKMQEEFTKGEEAILRIRKGFLAYEELEKETNKRMDEISIYMEEMRKKMLVFSEKIKVFPQVMKKDIGDLQNIIMKMGEILTFYEENFKNFEEIASLSEELSASSEEIAGKAQELNLISTKLSELTKIFE